MTAAQQSSQNPNSNTNSQGDRPSGYDPFSRSPIDDMRAKLRIKAEEKEFKDNLERAEEAEKISNELAKNFETNKTLSSEDKKKLERLEKLVKRVRNASGGGDDDVIVAPYQNNVTDILKKIAEETDKLNEEFKKTSRNVISAPVIETANSILDLIRAIRLLLA
jgi:archaellum component FlaC